MNLEYSEFEPLLRRLTSLFRRYIDRRSNNKKQPRSQPWRPPRNTPISNQKSLESPPDANCLIPTTKPAAILLCNVSTSAGEFVASRHPHLPYPIWQLDTSLYPFEQIPSASDFGSRFLL